VVSNATGIEHSVSNFGELSIALIDCMSGTSNGSRSFIAILQASNFLRKLASISLTSSSANDFNLALHFPIRSSGTDRVFLTKLVPIISNLVL
jgi:hypothetical protein